MSYDFHYYIGCRIPEKDGKYRYHPLGAFSPKGEFLDVLTRSRNSASNLYQDFYSLDEDEMSDELKRAYMTTVTDNTDEWDATKYKKEPYSKGFKYLPVTELPHGSFMQTGYFLISDVSRYEEEKQQYGDKVYDFDGFYEKLSPVVYAAKLQAEITTGNGMIKYSNLEADDTDYEGYDNETGHKASDFMYYAYPDFSSPEYEASILRHEASIYEFVTGIPDDAERIILETEG